MFVYNTSFYTFGGNCLLYGVCFWTIARNKVISVYQLINGSLPVIVLLGVSSLPSKAGWSGA